MQRILSSLLVSPNPYTTEMQDKSDPGNVLATSAFRKVIFRQCANVEPDAQQPAPLLPTAEETVLRLHVW